MDSAFARHERVHIAVPARSGATAGAWIVTLRMMREAAVSLDPVVTWSVGCLVATAGRAHDVNSRGERAASVLASIVDEASFARRSARNGAGRTRIGRSQEGESRALLGTLYEPLSFDDFSAGGRYIAARAESRLGCCCFTSFAASFRRR